MKYQFLHDEINEGFILLKHIDTEKNVADLSIKPMTRLKLNTFRKVILGFIWYLCLMVYQPL